MPYIIVEGQLGDRGGGSSRKEDENMRPQTPNTSRMASGSSPGPQFHVSVSGLKGMCGTQLQFDLDKNRWIEKLLE